MASQIIFYKKNFIDLSFGSISITVTDATATNTGQAFVGYLRNRKNSSAWITTGSNDAANTQLDIDWTDQRTIDNLLLVKHNFSDYTIQYWNGSAYVDFSSAINVSGGVALTTVHTFTAVQTSKIRLIITGTIVADADKIMRQFIATEQIGQLESWPIISGVVNSKSKKVTKALSGKSYVADTIGSFACSLDVEILKSSLDLAIFEQIFDSYEGVLVWLCGGDEVQFSSKRQGYRLEDIFLMRPVSEYNPDWFQGLYVAGIVFSIKLQESIT